jgi:hypothetical protein
VGRHGGLRVADAPAEINAGDKSGNAAGDMDHSAAGEVERRDMASGGVEESAEAPDHVSHRAIDEQGPE